MNSKELALRHRAQLFNALLEQHGEQGDWDKLFQLLNEGQRAARLAQMPEIARQMGEGRTLVLQGLRDSGKFLEWELSILEVGLATGNITESYRRLRDHYLVQEKFREEIRRQCKWPFAIATAVSAAMYGWLVWDKALPPGAAIATWLAVVVGLVGIEAAVTRLAVRILAGTASRRARWLHYLPGFGRVRRAGQLLHFFKNLGQSVAAQLPLAESLKLAAQKVPDPVCQREFMAVYDAVARGSRLSAALVAGGLLDGIALPPLSLSDAGPSEAMSHITDAVYSDYIERLWLLARNVPQWLFVFLPVIATVQVAML